MGSFCKTGSRRRQLHTSELAALKSQRKKRRRSTDYAMMVGAAFLLVGSAGFFLVQLHLGQ
jgi:hypothetical protein